jgi:hypothetical protein
MQFACTLEDINWYARGYDPRKLDYLNFKLGYFYEAHRAGVDCDALLNLLLMVPGVFDELRYNAHKKHLYFFSNRLLGKQSVASIASAPETQTHEKMPSQSEIDGAYALLSTLPQYKIYKAVPQPLPVASSAGQTQSAMTIIDIKTTGANYSEDSITEIGVLSFSMIDGVFRVDGSFTDALTEEHPINWGRVADMLMHTQSLLSHKNNTNRKFLECMTPPEVQCRVRALPCVSTDLDIDWRSRTISNSGLKYLSFTLGYYFNPECLTSQNYATLNLLHVVPGAYDEIFGSLQKNQTVILLTGPFCTAIRGELKIQGFQWSTGSGNMGKGWWACVDNDKTSVLMPWLLDAKEKASGRNEIYCKAITPLERYSIRAEFKAADMRTLARKPASKKRSLEPEHETSSSSSMGPK